MQMIVIASVMLVVSTVVAIIAKNKIISLIMNIGSGVAITIMVMARASIEMRVWFVWVLSIIAYTCLAWLFSRGLKYLLKLN